MGVEVAVIASAAAAGTAAYGQYQAGKAAETDGKNQQTMANYNAQVEERNAEAAESAARQNTRDNRDRANRIKATNRSWLAESGTIASGSPLKAAGYSSGQLEKDIQTAFVNDLTTADQFRNQAVVDRMEGRAAFGRGQAAKNASMFQAGSTILSGASRTYGLGREYGVWN